MGVLRGYEEFPILTSNTLPYFIYQPPRDNHLSLFNPHWHEQIFEIIYIVEGKARFHIEGQTFQAIEGDIFFIRERQIHSGETIDKTPNYYAILFNRHLLASPNASDQDTPAYFSDHLEPPPVLRINSKQYHIFSETIQAIIREYEQQKAGYGLVIKANLILLVTAMGRLYLANDRPKRSREADKRNLHMLNKVMRYIDEHYHEKLTIDKVSSIANMGTYHFCRVFKKATGRTFIEYVNLYRINKAEELIRDGDLSITDIADTVGFCNINYFDKLFRRYKHCTPTQYRKKHHLPSDSRT